MFKRFVVGLLAAAAAAPAWAQSTFHGNVARTGVYESAGPARLKGVKWAFKTGGPIVTSPVIAGGVVYIASLDGHLHAIDQETGQEKWKFKSRMPIASSPAVEGDTLYFVSSAGSLAALDVATGTPRWVLAVEYERKFEAKNLHGYPTFHARRLTAPGPSSASSRISPSSTLGRRREMAEALGFAPAA